ncbi:MAG: hypothetical protein M0Z72_04880 [Deltaproteobacteria bacterium]|nr:hypothetical protein [Deltaproteobacteria bacterium]
MTARANFGNYSISERMKASFEEFEKKFGGKVFIIFSVDDKIENIKIISDIEAEIIRLKS